MSLFNIPMYKLLLCLVIVTILLEVTKGEEGRKRKRLCRYKQKKDACVDVVPKKYKAINKHCKEKRGKCADINGICLMQVVKDRKRCECVTGNILTR